MISLRHRPVSHRTLYAGILTVLIAVLAVIVYTNKTLHSIEKNLPNTLFTELNSLSLALEDISSVVSISRIATVTKDPVDLAELRSEINTAYLRIVDLRETYVSNNLINASAFHAIVAPAIADLRIWVVEGVSGFGPEAPVTLAIITNRITEAFQKATHLKHESQIQAQTILDNQRKRLETFQDSVNTLFVMILVLAFILIFFLLRELGNKNKEILAKEELQQQHDLLDSLLKHIPLGIAMWDKDKNIISLNDGFIKITGYDQTDLTSLGKWPALAYPDPVYRQQVGEHWRMVGKSGASSEYRVTCKNGMVRDIEFQAAFLPDSRVINTLTDVTERNSRERALRESRLVEARARKMESLGLLAGGVAHDLNNILSGLVSYPELILYELPAEHKMRRPIEIMRESGLRASAIVQDLLTVARGVAIEKEPLNINVIIEDYLQSPDFSLVQQFHPEVRIATSLATDLANIMGSRVHIRKLLMNLVANSFEAIDVSGCVTVSTSNLHIERPLRGYSDIEEGDYVVLAVTDQGKGISAEDLEKIFEPFYSKKVMGRSGTGLGLSVVWNVVQDHHGHINVSSSTEGTQFFLYFPITTSVLRQPQPAVDLSLFRGKGERLLVVDDVSTQRFITASIVEKLGYRVETAPSGEAALECMQAQPFDMVLLDMIMSPGLSGRQTYERIIEMYPGQKAIIISGFAETDDVKETLRLGAGKFLKKPLVIHELAMAIQAELSFPE